MMKKKQTKQMKNLHPRQRYKALKVNEVMSKQLIVDHPASPLGHSGEYGNKRHLGTRKI